MGIRMGGIGIIRNGGIGILAFQISEILTGCVMISAFDFAVASADGGVDGLMSLPVEVTGEAVRSLTSGTGESG